MKITSISIPRRLKIEDNDDIIIVTVQYNSINNNN